MKNYFDYVCGEYVDTGNTCLLIAPRWTHFEKGQKVITDHDECAKVIASMTVHDDEREIVDFLCAAMGKEKEKLPKIVAKIDVNELDWSVYEEEEKDE